MTDIIDRLLTEEAKAQLKGQRVLAEVCRDASDQLGLIIEERDRLREALHRISLGSQNSGTTKEDLGREARAALKETGHE